MEDAGFSDINYFVPIQSPSIYGGIPLPEYALIDAMADLPSRISPDQIQLLEGNISPQLLGKIKTLFDSVLNEFVAK